MVNFTSVTAATSKLWLINVRACSFETIGKTTFGGSFFYLRGVPLGNHGSKANHEKKRKKKRHFPFKDISNAIREEYVQSCLHARGIVIQLMKLTKLKKKKEIRSVEATT